MLAQLGDIQFELLKGFTSFSATKSVDYAEHAVIEGKPKLQYVGDALDCYTITISFHADFCDPTEETKRLKDTMLLHEALPFIFGNGTYKGKFVIEEISDDIQTTFDDGTIIQINLNVSLKEWVKDQIITSRRARPKAVTQQLKKQQTASYSTTTVTNKDGVPFNEIVRQQ